MLKLLILCKTPDTVKNIINKMVSNITDLRIIGIANTTLEAEKIMEEIQPEIIITTIEEIIETIQDKFFHYYPHIVLFSSSTNQDINYKNLLVIPLQLKYEVITNKISEFIKTKVVSHREKATRILTHLGFDFKLNGTLYLLDAILYAHTYKGACSFEQLKRDIYPYISEINDTSANRVKWGIERSITYMYKKHTEDSYKIVERYFSIRYPEKPTPKLVINFISNHLDL